MQDRIGYEVNLAVFNFVYIEHFDPYYNLLVGLFFCFSLCCHKLIYIRNRGIGLHMNYAAMIEERRNYMTSVGIPMRRLHLDNMPSSDSVKRMAVFIINLFFGIHILNVFECEFHSSPYGFLFDVRFNDRFSSICKYKYLAFLPMDEGSKLYFRKIKRYQGRMMYNFLRFNSHTIQFITDYSVIYGQMFFLFILLNYPTNAIFVMMITLYNFPNRIVKMFIINVVIVQLTFLLVVHYGLTKLTKPIHAPVKKMIKLIAPISGSQNLTMKLRLAHYVENFHVKNHYAPTYGKYGKMTLKSFGRVSFHFIMEQILNLSWQISHINPFLKDFTFFRNYFSICFHLDRNVHLRIRLNQSLLWFGLWFCLVMLFLQDSIGHDRNVAIYNAVYMENFDSIFNLLLALFFVFAICCFQLLFIRNRGISSQMNYSALIEMHPNYMTSFVERMRHLHLKNMPKCRMVKRMAVLILNSFIGIHFLNVFECILCHVTFWLNVEQLSLFTIISFNLNSFRHVYITYLMCDTIIVSASFAVLNLWLMYRWLKAIELYCNKIKRYRPLSIYKFLRFNSHTIVLMTDLSQIFGQMFFLYLLFNYPSNAIFVIMISLYDFPSNLTKILIINIAIIQLAFLIFIHYGLAKWSKLIHAPAKKMMKLVAPINGKVNLSMKLRLAHYVEHFHTINIYAPTYGKYGKMTLNSFGKNNK
ncbi:hypothetical protein RDWZM_006873 [Blomia tropicalis]|uniref:Uncharacterized protein n=1 Tax=Blomia tropicalis TaxID=40697 RepID=A0A9Q0RNT7_BLOTA|nr:hypothetical protein RDWZM_006873 [Blomia tropicalis]